MNSNFFGSFGSSMMQNIRQDMMIQHHGFILNGSLRDCAEVSDVKELVSADFVSFDGSQREDLLEEFKSVHDENTGKLCIKNLYWAKHVGKREDYWSLRFTKGMITVRYEKKQSSCTVIAPVAAPIENKIDDSEKTKEPEVTEEDKNIS